MAHLVPGSSVISLCGSSGRYTSSDSAQQQAKYNNLWQRAGKAGLKGITEGSQLPCVALWDGGAC